MGTAMSTSLSAPYSPLDPFLAQFLAAIEEAGEGFQAGPELGRMAERLEVPREFLEGLLTSARTRGLVKPVYGRGSKIRWGVSPQGLKLVEVFRVDQTPDA